MCDSEEKMITISFSDYLEFVRDSVMLGELYRVGVDCWDGYSEINREQIEREVEKAETRTTNN